MFFPQGATADNILFMIKPKLEALINGSAHGVDIEMRKHIKKRTKNQNDYLWAIYKNIVEFNKQAGLSAENGGYLPDHLMLKFINSKFLHLYLKARFDIETTTKLTTTEFAQYTDSIQNLMVEQSKGAYDPIYPETTEQYFERVIR